MSVQGDSKTATTTSCKIFVIFFILFSLIMLVFFIQPPGNIAPRRPPQLTIPWFISVELNKPDYVAMAGVALITARKYPILEPHVMISNHSFSPTHPFILWMTQENITFYNYIPVLSKDVWKMKNQNQVTEGWVETALGGVFGRYDAARVYREHGGSEGMVLYTDVDVMWVNDPSDLVNVRVDENPPAVLAIGAEAAKGTKLNSGAMWIDVERWLETAPGFYQYCRSQKWQGPAWDQGLLLNYFLDQSRTIFLPDKFNYKLYWGSPPGQEEGDRPVMLHFHGPKPKKCLDGCGAIDCPTEAYVGLLEQTKSHPGLCLKTLAEFEEIYDAFQCPGDEGFVRYGDLQSFPVGSIRAC